MSPISKELIKTCADTLKDDLDKIRVCLNSMDEDKIWWRANAASNSLGNILLHLAGNVRQYILCGIGDREDTRVRSFEFEAKGPIPKTDLMNKLTATVEQAMQIILGCDEDKLVRTKQIQGKMQSGTMIIIHVTEHFSYHTGQIAYMTKSWSGKSLDLSDDRKLENRK